MFRCGRVENDRLLVGGGTETRTRHFPRTSRNRNSPVNRAREDKALVVIGMVAKQFDAARSHTHCLRLTPKSLLER